jgi:hypothetical protein
MTLTKQEKLLEQLKAVLNIIAFHDKQILRLKGDYTKLLWEALEDAEMPEK